MTNDCVNVNAVLLSVSNVYLSNIQKYKPKYVPETNYFGRGQLLYEIITDYSAWKRNIEYHKWRNRPANNLLIAI